MFFNKQFGFRSGSSTIYVPTYFRVDNFDRKNIYKNY